MPTAHEALAPASPRTKILQAVQALLGGLLGLGSGRPAAGSPAEKRPGEPGTACETQDRQLFGRYCICRFRLSGACSLCSGMVIHHEKRSAFQTRANSVSSAAAEEVVVVRLECATRARQK